MKTSTTVIAAALGAWLAACGSMSSPPTPVAPAAVSPPAATSISGTWTGTGSDSFSPERITLVMTQSGASISGTAEINAVDPADGTCGSCHKVKRGTLTGTVAGGAVTMSMKFPAGGDVPAPICDAEFNATASVSDRRLTGSYTGSDTCEGTYSNGVIDLARQ